MQTLSPGKFEIQLGSETRTVLVSLGLKTELYKLITNSQVKMASLQRRVFLDPELGELIKEKDSQVKALEAEEASEEDIEAVRVELEELYATALKDLEERQAEAFEKAVIEKIDLTQSIFVDAIICLLSERSERGVITAAIDKDTILWDPIYAEAQEELADLLTAVTEYITSALKKISGISKMVQETAEEATEKQSPKAPAV